MKLDNVSFSFHAGQPIIQNISADVVPGSILSIIGPNGAGKTTLLKLMANQLKPTSGQISLNNQFLAKMTRKQLASKIAVVSQQNHLYDDMQVIDVVKMGRLAKHHLLATVEDKEVLPYLEMTRTSSLAHRAMSHLSGGQRQRVWIASAIAQEPQYLLLDEPTTYLDIRYQSDLMAVITELHKKKNMTIVMILHDINQAFKMSDQLWLIRNGRLIAQGAPSRYYDEKLLSDIFNISIHIVTIPNYGHYIIELPADSF